MKKWNKSRVFHELIAKTAYQLPHTLTISNTISSLDYTLSKKCNLNQLHKCCVPYSISR